MGVKLPNTVPPAVLEPVVAELLDVVVPLDDDELFDTVPPAVLEPVVAELLDVVVPLDDDELPGIVPPAVLVLAAAATATEAKLKPPTVRVVAKWSYR
ncbi:MAG: hypothetical protein AB1847_14160 [bacterium]